MKVFKDEEEAWKRALKVINHWRGKRQTIFQSLDDKVEVSIYLTLDDEEDLMDRIKRSKYFSSFGRDLFGEYVVFRFQYIKREMEKKKK